MCLSSQVPSVLVDLVVFLLWGYWETVFFFEFLEILVYSMGELSRSWGKLSLSRREDSGFVLLKARKSNEFIIVAEFFTTRALNMDAMGRTFKQLWRYSKGFRIQNLNDHKVLLVFDDEWDVNWILISQPRSFNKHLVVVQRYEKDILLSSLTFETMMF